ncbi:hypothetical protein Ndes2526A_g01476 [Nannochloris sp. 'desiccata']
MHAFNLRGSILLAAVALLYIPHHSFCSLQTPPVDAVPPPTVTGPITQPPLLNSVPAQAATTAAGVCATPLEFLQCRDNVGTFLAAMQAAGLNNFLTSRTAVQTIFVPTDTAFNALLQSQGLTSTQLLQNTQTLKYILQNHILPNVEVRVADMVIGASWPTINPNEQLTVQSPVAAAIANGDLRACNTLIQETNVVLVPAGAFAAAGTAAVATAAPVPASTVATTAPVAAPQVAQQVATTQQKQVVQQQQQVQASAPAAFSSELDITKINANFG